MEIYNPQGVGSGSIQRGRIESQRPPGRASKGKADPLSSASDRVEISEEARDLHKLNALLERAREAYDQLPEIRQERIAEVKTRLDQGLYDGKTMTEEVADILLESGIIDIVGGSEG